MSKKVILYGADGKPFKPDPPKRRVGRPRVRPIPPDKARKAEIKEGHRQTMEHNRLVTVELTMRHLINGKSVGPGPAKVPNAVATDLLNTEARARAVEEQFQGTKAVIVGPRGPTGAHITKQVPVETFDSSYENAEPFAVINVPK